MNRHPSQACVALSYGAPPLAGRVSFHAAAHIFILACLAGLSGCANLPKTVQISVPVPCISTVPTRPDVIADNKALPRGERTRNLLIWQDSMTPYVEQLEGIAQGCARIPAP